MIIDTHCHLDFEPLYSRLDNVISIAESVGVSGFIIPGVHPDAWEKIASIASNYRCVKTAFGVHPMYSNIVDDDLLHKLGKLAKGRVAVGEIGLDSYCEISMEKQELGFRLQLKIALALGLPVLIHCRKAFQRTFQIMVEENAGQIGGIIHAFSGSPEMAWRFIRLGFVISVSGIITHPDAIKPLRLVNMLPLEHLVVETDAPDMTPKSKRGEANEPAFIVETVNRIAEIKNISPEKVADMCSATSRRILRI